MSHYVFDVHAVISELNKRNQTQVVAADIDDPPFIFVPEIIKRWKHPS